MHPFPTMMGAGGGFDPLSATFNLSDAAPSVVLSNGNKSLATAAGGTNANDGARCITSHNAGYWRFEITVADGAGWFNEEMGVCNAGVSMDGAFAFTPLMSSANSFGVKAGTSTANYLIYANGNLVATVPEGIINGSVIAIDVDLDGRRFWVQRLGGTRQGPHTYSAISGALFPFAMVYVNVQTLSVNLGTSPFQVASASAAPWG